jgi:hypothetical protein
VSGRHRVGGWWRTAAQGRAEQPAIGRHTAEHSAGARPLEVGGQLHRDGLYPMGAAYRGPRDLAVLEALDSLDNDPHAPRPRKAAIT